jgi:hypothetical protein
MLLKKKLPIAFLVLHFLLLTLPALFLGMTFPLLHRMLGSVASSYWLLQAGLFFWCMGGIFTVLYFSKLNHLIFSKYRLLVAAWVQLVGFFICTIATTYFFFFLGMTLIGIGGSWFLYLSMLLFYWLNLKRVYLYVSYGILAVAAISPFLSEIFLISSGWRIILGALFTANFFFLIPYTYLKPHISEFILNEKPMRNPKVLSSLKPLCSAIALISALFLYWFSIASIMLEARLDVSPSASLVDQGIILICFLLGTVGRALSKKIGNSEVTLAVEFLFWFALLGALGFHLYFPATAITFVFSLSTTSFLSGILFANLLGDLLKWPHIRFQRKVQLLLERFFTWGAVVTLFSIILPRAPAQVLSIFLIIGGAQVLYYYLWLEKIYKAEKSE